MNNKNKTVPQLRFPGFNGEWEVKKLGEVAEISKGKGISKSDIVDNGLNECIRYGELYTNYKETISDIISRTNVSTNELILSKVNDVIIPSSGETELDIATASCILKNNVAIGGDLNIIRTKNNGVFLSYYLNYCKKFEIASLAQGKSVVHLYSEQLKTLNISFPTLPEQEKIANFLTAVDEKLKALKKKKNLLEQYKKGVMQRIFSQELRFSDDNGKPFPAWEMRKLGEVGDFLTSSIDKLSHINEKEVYLVNYMNVYRHETITNETIKSFQVVTAKQNQIETFNLKRGDILFTPSSETPDDIGHSVVIYEDLENAVYSYHLLRFRPKVTLSILYSHYFCNIPQVLKQLTKLATGSTRFTISIKSFSNIIVSLPSLPEQEKIAKFLSAIDDKIVIVQKEIEKLEEWKRGLLQRMFV